jgi:hypothetical protein
LNSFYNIYSGLWNLSAKGMETLGFDVKEIAKNSAHRSENADVTKKTLGYLNDLTGNLAMLGNSVGIGSKIASKITTIPILQHVIGNVIGFNAIEQPQLLNEVIEGKITPIQYLESTLATTATGVAFASNPFHAKNYSEHLGTPQSPQQYHKQGNVTRGEWNWDDVFHTAVTNFALDILMGGKVQNKKQMR